MIKIAIAGGHSRKAPGAVGYLNEYLCDRAMVAHLIPALRDAGFDVLDCSNEEPTERAELVHKVEAANAWDADIFLDVHFNAGGGTGAECWYYSSSVEGRALAARMSADVAAAFGIPDRGAKASTSLYVLKATKMTAVLLETCFVDSEADLNAWNNTGWDEICAAVVKSLGGVHEPAEPSPAPMPEPAPQPAERFGGRYVVRASSLNIRDRPSLSGNVVGSYSKGDTVVLDDAYTRADGYIWGQYTAYSGKRRYVAVGRATGKPEVDDYLVKG